MNMRTFLDYFSWLDPALQFIERAAVIINAIIFAGVAALALFVLIVSYL